MFAAGIVFVLVWFGHSTPFFDRCYLLFKNRSSPKDGADCFSQRHCPKETKEKRGRNDEHDDQEQGAKKKNRKQKNKKRRNGGKTWNITDKAFLPSLRAQM
jgi:hypothetical protein